MAATARSTAQTPRSPAQVLKMEALGAADEPVLVEVVPGVEVAVKPPRKWRISALRALGQGDFETWARGALASETDVDAFLDADPELGDLEAFMERLDGASAEGKSRTLSPSSSRSRNTRKR